MPCRLMACCLLFLLSACTGTRIPSAPAVPIAEVMAEMKIGAARTFDACSWLPGSAGFSPPVPVLLRTGGQILLMGQAVQWGRYDVGSGTFNVARKIPFEHIRSVSLAQKKDQRLIVVEGRDGRFDSFGVQKARAAHKTVPEFDPASTAEVYRALLAQMGLSTALQ